MADANYFREWAQRCRALAQIASRPEVIYQLQVWAMDFDRDAGGGRGRRAGRSKRAAATLLSNGR